MKSCIRLFITVVILSYLCIQANAIPPVKGEFFSITPITNEVSLYKNVDDGGNDRGQTIQIIAINSIHLLTDFNFEFTADFNWEMSDRDSDNYMEFSLVKPFGERFSLNYQRIIATFEDEPVNQFGIRFSF
jgi:hypothetical protein